MSARGWLVTETRPNRKSEPIVRLNPNVRGLPQSPTLRINEICASLRAEGRTVYTLGLGQSPFPVPQPVVEALKANAHQKDYLAVRGLWQLRSAVADYCRRTQGVERSADDALICPGSK
jgi:aspartate aminotransferase